MTVEDKINNLGGIKANPSCKYSPITDDSIRNLELIIKAKLPETFKLFHSSYGAFSFKERVKVKCIEKPPISLDKGLVKVDYFYSADKESTCSILKLIEQYSDQIPKGFIPICDGEPGDLICINLNKEKYGSIYYWWHEGNIGEDLFKIDDTFEGFIFKLKIIEDDVFNNSEISNIKVNASAELLKRLKKSGLGPR